MAKPWRDFENDPSTCTNIAREDMKEMIGFSINVRCHREIL